MSDFTHIVSLGGNCRLTYNLRRHYGFNSGYPFDWWITTLPAATKVLEEPDLQKLFNPKFLRGVVPKHGRGISTVRNTYYRISMNHEFPREKKFVVPDFKQHIKSRLERQTYLFDKLRAIDSRANSVLLVRYFIPSEIPKVSAESVERFLSAARRFFQTAEPQFLFINSPVERDDVMMLHIQEAPKGPWRGDEALWSSRLATMPISYVGEGLTGGARINPSRESLKDLDEIDQKLTAGEITDDASEDDAEVAA
jgi:hypothetical protein